MDWKVLADVGFGAAALVMARRLSVTVQLLSNLVRDHEKTLSDHESRLAAVEASRKIPVENALKAV